MSVLEIAEDEKSENPENRDIIFKCLYQGKIRYPSSISNDNFTLGGITSYLKAKDKYISDEQLKSYLITVNYDTATSYIEAWSSARRKIDSIIKALIESQLPIHQMCSSIEFVPKISASHKTSKIHNAPSLDILYEEYTKAISDSSDSSDSSDPSNKNVKLLLKNIDSKKDPIEQYETMFNKLYGKQINDDPQDKESNYRKMLKKLTLCTFETKLAEDKVRADSLTEKIEAEVKDQDKEEEEDYDTKVEREAQEKAKERDYLKTLNKAEKEEYKAQKKKLRDEIKLEKQLKSAELKRKQALEKAKRKREQAKVKYESKIKVSGEPKAVKIKTFSKMPILYDIDEMQYTEYLHNIIQEMIYTKTITGADEDLVGTLFLLQQEIEELMSNGKPYIFPYIDEFAEHEEIKKALDEKRKLEAFKSQTKYKSLERFESNVWCNQKPNLTKAGEDPRKYCKNFRKRYVSSFWLFLAYVQDTLGATTLGYPHFHISLLTEASTHYVDLGNEFAEIAKNASGLIDVKVDRHRSEPAKPTVAMTYVFKNHSAKNTFFPIAKFSNMSTIGGQEFLDYLVLERQSICKSYINLNSKYADYFYNLLSDICVYRGKDIHSSNEKGRNKTVVSDIIGYSNPSSIDSEKETIDIDNFKLMDPEILKHRHRYVRLIQDTMKRQNLAICKGRIYRKNKKSKTSWNYYKTIDKFIDDTSKDPEYSEAKADQVKKWMKMTDEEIIDSKATYANFRRINICFKIIEFGDFWFCTVTREIYKENLTFSTFRYCPIITLENLYSSMDDLIETSIWIEALKRSKIYTVRDIGIYSLATVDRENNKNQTVVAAGESNTGKSQLLAPFIALFPTYLVGRMQGIGNFNISQQFHEDKAMVVVEEGNIMLRAISGGGLASLLQVTEGGIIAADGKFLDEVSCNTGLQSLFINVNISSKDDDIFNSITLTNRFLLLHLGQSLEEDLIKFTGDIAAYESPLIIMFAAMCNLAIENKLDYIPKLPVVERLDEEEVKRINKRNTLYTDSAIEYDLTQPITKLSKLARQAKIEKQTVIKIFEIYEHPDLPSFNSLTHAQHLSEIKVLIKQIKKAERDAEILKKKEERELIYGTFDPHNSHNPENSHPDIIPEYTQNEQKNDQVITTRRFKFSPMSS
jgi:hypothetical protein